MDSDSDASSSPSRAGTQEPRRTNKSSRGGQARSGRSSLGFIKVLLREQSNIHELRSVLQDMNFRLQDETRRADNAERTARETVLRFKEANDLRLAAQLEVTRLKEELRLYQVQLETAQREILRGQELLDVVESQRHEAEESAARARTTARKYKEEKLVLAARQEGREQGVREGIKRGRMLGYEDGRTAGYQSGWADAVKHFEKEVVDVSINARTPSVSLNQFPLPPEPEENIHIYSPAEHLQPQVAELQDIEPQIHIHAPSNTESDQVEEAEAFAGTSRPQSVHSGHSATSAYHIPVEYSPDAFLPHVGADQRMYVPAPHVLAPTPPTPDATPPLVRRTIRVVESPPLMIPPPGVETLASDTVSDSDTGSLRSTSRRPRPRRRTSDDSQSTTFSQFALVGPPVASSARTNVAASPSALSAIMEEKERSPSMASTVRNPMPSPDGPMLTDIAMPTPRSAVAGQANVASVGTSQITHKPHHLDPNAISSRRSPSRSPTRASLSPNGSIASSVGYHAIVVEPPSRPESWRSGEVLQMGGLLSPRDADRPLPQLPPTTTPTTGTEVINELPPGFVPSGRGGHTGVAFAPPSAPLSAVSHTAPAPSADPIPVRTPTAQSGRYRRAESVSDGSTSSSLNSLTTPPNRRNRLPSMIYASTPAPSMGARPPAADASSAHPEWVPLPPSTADSSGTETASAARVPLPLSSAGSPRSVYTRPSRRTGRSSGSAA